MNLALSLWGWPGVIVLALVGLEIAERVLRRRFVSGRRKAAIGMVAVVLGVLTAGAPIDGPVAHGPTPQEQIDKRIERNQSDRALTAQVDALRKETR